MSEPKQNDLMAQYIADILTSHCASEENTSDFVLAVDGNRIAYADVEGGTVWLVTVEEAILQPGGAAVSTGRNT